MDIPTNTDMILTPRIEEALNLMENTSTTFFLTGKAGTGKSTLLQHWLSTTRKRTIVLAPTGVAALNIGGETIHSFFKFPARFINPREIRKLTNWNGAGHLIDTIIIDEISMVRSDMLDNIDQFLRINTGVFDKPFGGIRMIFVGDIFQLCPVVEKELEPIFSGFGYDSPFFFSAKVFGEMNIRTIELDHIFRQSDNTFIDVLNRARIGRVTPADIKVLNSRFNPPILRQQKDVLYVTTTNSAASSINTHCLTPIRDKGRTYDAEMVGDFDTKLCPTDEHLHLKPGAQIMMVKNDTKEGRWVNGSMGKVVECLENKVIVTIGNTQNKVEVIPETWERIKYTVSDNDIKPTTAGKFIQMPIKLAWAITIHKSQGLTFDKVAIDFGRGTFTHGQAYVALSRCRTLEGTFLTRPFRAADIIVDKRAVSFLVNSSNNNKNNSNPNTGV